MKWTCLLLFGVCLTFTALGQTTYTWTGATMRDEDPHNNSNSWDAPGNWAPQGVPGAGDTVVIGNGDTVAAGGDRTVHALRLSAGALNFGPGAGITTGGADSSWSGGWLTGVWRNSGTLLLEGGDRGLGDGSALVNTGTVRWISGTTVGWQNCTVTNQAGALWVFTGAGDPFGNFFAGNQFISHGTVRLAAAAAVGLDEWSYTLGGRVEREGGTMSVFADLGLVPGVAFSGTGVFRKDGGMLWITGAVRNADGRFELAGGTLMSEPTTPGSLVGDFVWSGGNWTGVVVVPVGSQVEITGSCRLNGASRIDNHGTMKWNSGTALEGWENSTVHNHTDGLYLFAREGTAFVNFFGGNRFINDGVARHTATGTVVLNSWDFALNGALERNGGAIDLAATATCADGAEFRGSGTFRLTGGTLTAAGEIINSDGVFDFAGGTAASGASPLTLVGDFIWSGGSWIGAFEVPAGSELAMTGYCRLGGASRIDNHGTVKWNSDTPLEGWENCIVQNHTDGLYLFAREGSAFMNFFGGNRFINDGVARHTATGTVVLNSWDFVFNGAVERNGGVFELAAAVTCADGAEFRGAGTFRLTGGTLTAAGEVINSHGTFDFVGGTAASGASAIKLAGDFIWSGGYWNGELAVPAGSQVTITGNCQLNGASRIDNHGTVKWNSAWPLTGWENATIHNHAGGYYIFESPGDPFGNFFAGNRFLNDGTLLNRATSPCEVNDWTVVSVGVMRTAEGAVTHVSGPLDLLDGARVEGAGPLRLTGSTTTVRGTTTVATGALLDLAGASVNGHADGTGRVTGGAVEWSGGWLGGLLTVDASFAVVGPGGKWLAGAAELRNAGAMTMVGIGSLNAWENSVLRNLPGATLHCAGTHHLGQFLGGNKLVNEGTMTIGGSPGRQTMDWAFQQTTTGTLVVEVAGSDPSPPEFDILQVSGGIQLGGILLASTSGGYDPAEGQTFEIITGSPVSGTFIPQIIKGFEIDYQPGAVLLVATGAGLAYATWAASYELAGDAALPGMDPDGDGQVNFLEYAFNTSPILAAASPTRFAVEENGGHAWLVLRYRMWQDRVDAGLNYQPQRSADLGVWLTEGIIDEPDLGAPPLAGSAARRCRIPLHPGSREFLRLGVGF